MRCELMQMERMAIDERFGTDAGNAARRMEDIRRRMRLEKTKMEEEANEHLAD